MEDGRPKVRSLLFVPADEPGSQEERRFMGREEVRRTSSELVCLVLQHSNQSHSILMKQSHLAVWVQYAVSH